MFRYEPYEATQYKHIQLINLLMKKNDFYVGDIPTIIENRGKYEGFIMFDDQVAIGFILYLNESQRTLAPYILISFMLIDKKYRNKGCGTLLYKNAEEVFNKYNDLLIVLGYIKLDGNPNFWRKFDFKKNWRGLENTSKVNKDCIKLFNKMEKIGCLGMSYLYKITQLN